MRHVRLAKTTLERRSRWTSYIETLRGSFADAAGTMWHALAAEVKAERHSAALEHLQLCGTIPERYGHDSTEEKLYSKYTDMVLALAFDALGLRANVIAERADAADVDIVCGAFCFVADAKAFRLSRTAKNQKDFKVESMARWKGDREHSLLVCPIFQYPSTTSQIYHQAISRRVCLLSYMHLRVLVRAAAEGHFDSIEDALLLIFNATENARPTKDAREYWRLVNRALVVTDSLEQLWEEEWEIEQSAMLAAQAEALDYLKKYEEGLEQLSKEELLAQLIRATKLRQKAAVIRRQSGTDILNVR